MSDEPDDVDPGRHQDRGNLQVSRRQREPVVIGDVRVTVKEAGPRDVRLFIEAPREMPVRRDPR